MKIRIIRAGVEAAMVVSLMTLGFWSFAAFGATPGSIQAGDKLYHSEHVKDGNKVSCASCHTADPRKTGMTRANKEIAPMAPSVNAERFTDPAKMAKWFRRNCNDVLSRECTEQEKADFLAYVKSVK